MASLGVIEHWISRAAWGAEAANCSDPLFPEDINRIFVHYTASGADRQANHANCAERWKGVQTFHQETRGWCDVAYSIGTCVHGFALEGRGFGRKTAATGPCNVDSYAIVFMGNDSTTRDDVGSLGREVIAECVAEIEIRKARKLGVPSVSLPVFGHRDCMSTACPGDELYGWINSTAFRQLVRAQKAGDELKAVWQLRAGRRRILKQIDAKVVGDKTGLQRLIEWELAHMDRIREAERVHGVVSKRKLKVPA